MVLCDEVRSHARSPRRLCAVALSCIVALGASCSLAAETAEAATLEELAAEVERTSARYSEAVAEQSRLAGEIEGLQAQILDLEAKMPALEDQFGKAAVQMYKDTTGGVDVVEMLLGSESFGEALRLWQTYNKIIDDRSDRLMEVIDAKDSLADSKSKLEQNKAAADAAVGEAKQSLDDATAARKQAQAAAKAAGAGALAKQIDWTMPKDEFVSHWAGRIDSYLSGTPLAGQGKAFADAAYQYGVDPRWSPAISRIESSCGAACFRPHNAWGWMGKSFGSWSDAIYAHVKYLSGPLYGGYLTPKGAATYCPPGGPWYSKVSAEMSRM